MSTLCFKPFFFTALEWRNNLFIAGLNMRSQNQTLLLPSSVTLCYDSHVKLCGLFFFFNLQLAAILISNFFKTV